MCVTMLMWKALILDCCKNLWFYRTLFYLFTVHEPPYLISVLPKVIEIRTIDPHVLVQSINLQNVKCIYQGSDHLYLASHTHVWRLSTVPIPIQIRQLLQNKEFELALQLAVRFQFLLLTNSKNTVCKVVDSFYESLQLFYKGTFCLYYVIYAKAVNCC